MRRSLLLSVSMLIAPLAPAQVSRVPIEPVARLESVPPGEADAIREIVKLSEERVRHAAVGTKARRDAHAKHHGCVTARFDSADGVSERFARGVFAPGTHYDAIVRFSNGNPSPRSDREPDGRGMAVKLIGVPGEKLLDDERETQDFVMIDNPRFFIPDVETYLSFSRANDSEGALALAGFFLLHPRLFLIAREVTGHRVVSPLEITYHSMTPYLLGSREDGLAVKYRFDPVACLDGSPIQQSETDEGRGDDFLRAAMVERLAPGMTDACFDVNVVAFRGAAPETEDASREWAADETDTVRVARLTIPAQAFASDEQLERCENLSFTPWHALVEHQPLGGLNRLRLQVYQATSRLRHELNGVPQLEPGSTHPPTAPE